MASIRSGIGENVEDRYLFKGKRLDNGVWVQGYLFGIWEKRYILWGMTNDIPNMIEVDPSTICQCTGLKDKNGKLIWEGDIILFQLDNDDCPFLNKDTKKRLGKVFYKGFRTTFAIGMGKNGSSSINDDLWKYVQNGNRVEVIGNVFDNAELLENEGQHGRKEL